MRNFSPYARTLRHYVYALLFMPVGPAARTPCVAPGACAPGRIREVVSWKSAEAASVSVVAFGGGDVS